MTSGLGFLDAPHRVTKTTAARLTRLVNTAHGERATVAFMLWVLLAIVHCDIIFAGRSLVYSSNYNPIDPRPLMQNYGPHFAPPSTQVARNLLPYANLRDPTATWVQWEPAGEFLKKAIELGEWPFWDPYVAAGTPAMANLIPAFLFPPYIVLQLLGSSEVLKNGYFLTLLWGAAFCTYLFLRRHDVAASASFFGAVCVLFSGAINQNIASFMGQTAACLPCALYATRVLLDRPTFRRAAVVASVYASIALASFPPLLVGVFGVTALYAIVVLLFEQKPNEGPRLRIARYAAAVLLSVGLVAFYYAPALALRASATQVEKLYRDAGLQSMPFRYIFQLLSPALAGGTPIYLQPAVSPTDPHIPYVGITPVLLALVAGARGHLRRRSVLIASVIAGVLITLKLFGVPPVQWIGHLRFFKEIHFAHYLGVPLGFVVALIGALGMEAVLRGAGAASQSRALVASAVCIVAVAALRYIAAPSATAGSVALWCWLRDWAFLSLITVASCAWLLFATFGHAAERKRVWLASGIVLLCIVEGIFNNFYPHQTRWNIFQNPIPFVRALQTHRNEGRVLAFGGLGANLNSAFEVFSLDSLMAYNPPRMFSLYHRYTGSRPQAFMREPATVPPEPVLDRAAVRFIPVHDAQASIVSVLRQRGYRKLFDDGFLSVFTRDARPRYFFSSAYRVVSREVALEDVSMPPSDEIILEEYPGVEPAANRTDDPDVTIEGRSLNSLRLVVNAPRPGLLYVSESFFDGWKAFLNGREVRIRPANYAFRAVVVPQGLCRVEFKYWPPGLTAGLTISAVSAGIATVLVVGWLPNKPRSGKGSPR